MTAHPLIARVEVVIHDPATLYRDVALAIARHLEAAITARSQATLVLAGGRTPRGVYAHLATLDLPWPRVSLLFGDERAVPPDDPASNFAMVETTLLAPLAARGFVPTVLRVPGELGADRAAPAYAALIAPLIDPPEAPFDLVLLGLGDDGHVASIFPASPATPTTPTPTTSASTPPVIATTSPVAPFPRVSLTLPTLARARAVFVLVTGESKAARLAEVLTDPACTLPAARFSRLALDRAADLVFHVDPHAARDLSAHLDSRTLPEKGYPHE